MVGIDTKNQRTNISQKDFNNSLGQILRDGDLIFELILNITEIRESPVPCPPSHFHLDLSSQILLRSFRSRENASVP